MRALAAARNVLDPVVTFGYPMQYSVLGEAVVGEASTIRPAEPVPGAVFACQGTYRL